MTDKINLLNYNREDLGQFFVERGEKAFRATQIIQWLHQYGVASFAEMTNLSKALREELQEIAEVKMPTVLIREKSRDGTCKWLSQLEQGNSIETVFIPEPGRGTLCVSSQVGCALDCSFCATGKQGFNRNLSVAEIIAQVWMAVHEGHKVTNVVMMGMGEPLLNFKNVVRAMDIMMDDFAYGLSKYRVTLSTSGIIPAMKNLQEVSECALAVSLHAPNDELRNILVPINKKYPLQELMEVCKEYYKNSPRRAVTFEYVMLAGINDSRDHAKQLRRLLQDIPCKVNLIPFNSFSGVDYKSSSPEVIDEFRSLLTDIQTNVRKTRGDDINAACGQLVGKVIDRTLRTEAGRLRRNDEA